MGREVRLRVSLLLVVQDSMVEIHHLLHLESFLLTFPEGMPLPGVQREAGAAIKSTVQCISKVRYLPCVPSLWRKLKLPAIHMQRQDLTCLQTPGVRVIFRTT